MKKTKIFLNSKLIQKLILLSKKEKNEENALKYFTGNLVKCESKNSNYLKKKFLNFFKFNENISSSLNINSDKIMSNKTIFRLTSMQKINKEELKEILEKDKYSIFRENDTNLKTSK